MAPSTLTLKVGCPIILLTNLSPATGLANGTRLICKRFTSKVIEATIATGHHKNKCVFIPRITRYSNEADLTMPIHFKRRHFPLRLAFAMTINRSQGQTLSRVGIYLPQSVFAHGQFYTAASRTPLDTDTTIMAVNSKIEGLPDRYTKNVVFQEVLH